MMIHKPHNITTLARILAHQAVQHHLQHHLQQQRQQQSEPQPRRSNHPVQSALEAR